MKITRKGNYESLHFRSDHKGQELFLNINHGIYLQRMLLRIILRSLIVAAKGNDVIIKEQFGVFAPNALCSLFNSVALMLEHITES